MVHWRKPYQSAPLEADGKMLHPDAKDEQIPRQNLRYGGAMKTAAKGKCSSTSSTGLAAAGLLDPG
jgi:hypothetical protein